MAARVLLGTLLALLLLPGTADAAPWTCDASAVRGTLASAPPIDPVAANRGAAECRTQSAGGNLPAGLPLGLGGSAVFARTRVEGDAARPAGQRVTAEGGLAELRVPLLPGVPGLPAPPTIPPVTVGPFGTIDLNPALRALAAPTGDLVRLGAVTSRVTGQCSSGRALLEGDSSVASLRVLGLELPTDRATRRTIGIDSRSIDPSNIDPTVVAPPGVDLTAFRAALQPVLDALPTITVPGAAAQVNVIPAAQSRAGDTLTQLALQIDLSIGGQAVLDLVAGEARVGGAAVGCGAAVAAQALRCTRRRLVLVNVVRRGRRVRLLGAADRGFAGRRVSIVSTHTGRTVARPRVGSDGIFRATAPLPPANLRRTNRARYQARIGAERSLRLKLARRLTVTSIRPRGRDVVVSGRVSRPLASPVQLLVVTRRVSCGRVEVVKRFRPSHTGRFRVVLPGAKRRQVAVFRFRTRVRFSTRNPRLFRTFTLPQYVDVG